MSDRFAALEHQIDTFLCDGVFPGCVVLIASRGEILYQQAFGYSATLPEKTRAEIDTVYDSASLTKPLITAALILLLIKEGALSLETTLGDLFEDCPEDKSAVTIMDLLTHRGGIIAWYPLFAIGSSLDSYLERIFALPLAAPARTQVIYSCPGFILLAKVIEKVTGERFADHALGRLIKPLKLERTSLGAPGVPLSEVAATEDSSSSEREMTEPFGLDYGFREGIIRGQTHDTNSHAVGGSAGNAGLFTTARDALILTEQWGARSKLLGRDLLAEAGRNYTPFGPQHRGLGWQLASSPGCSACPELSPDSLGHTGFTGCSAWFDRKHDLTIIIMSNRLHPQVGKTDMAAVRRRLCSLAIQSALG
jgi:CubicO group peptidase (beta-lactamase class C family)